MTLPSQSNDRPALSERNSNSMTTIPPRLGILAGLIAAICTLAFAAITAPVALGAVGDRFSFAEVTDPDTDTTAPAYPGQRAFWAGTCDLTNTSTTNGGTGAHNGGSDPSGTFAHCIDHPSVPAFPGSTFYLAPIPPLSPGLSPNAPLLDGSLHPDGWGSISSPIPSWRLDPVTEAGSHPDATTGFWFSRSDLNSVGAGATGAAPDGSPRNITVKLPPGVVGDPNAVPKCSSDAIRAVPASCPPQTQVGVTTITVGGKTAVNPVYNVEPRDGKTAEFVISGAGLGDLKSNVPLVATPRTDGDFGIDAMAMQIPSGLALTGQTFTFWGVPWAASHDVYRPIAAYCGSQSDVLGMPTAGLAGGTAHGCSQEPQSYDPSWGPIKPFMSLQTECDGREPQTTIIADNYHRPDVVATEVSPAPAMTGCEKPPFNPSASFSPTSTAPDSASGLSVNIDIPQNNTPPAAVASNPDDATGAPAFWKSPAGRATAHLDRSVVTLPEGMSVNPSAAAGLEACSDAQVGITAVGNPYLFNNVEPVCSDGSRIGTVSATTPLLEGSPNLTGDVVLGTPQTTNPQGETDGRRMFRLFLILRSPGRGLLVKVYGSAVADPNTGRLTAIFDKNPRVPVENIRVEFKGGGRGVFAMPQTCGPRSTAAVFSPWTAAHNAGGQPRGVDSPFAVDGDCSFGFSPSLQAGMDTQAARSSGSFSFRFLRRDGEQWLRGLTTTLPKGLLASVKDVPLCSNQAASAGACPAGSQIGVVDAKAGSGDPFVLEEKGEVFLTEGYKGGEYGLAVKIRPVAGPFHGSMELSPIVVRQAIHVDRKTAQVTAVSDPFPLIHHGIPLRVREVVVLANRGGFMLNPSDCAAKQVAATLTSDRGTNVDLSNAFQAAGCSNLAFKPKLALRLTGRKQVKTGKHPGIRAVVTQRGVPEAGIEKAQVRLPKILALDVDNAQALCEYDQGTRPDLENHCPKGSIVGRSRAVSPLLNDPLVGNVYFVKNVRRSASGNLIRTLPMIVVALRGEIAVNLVGESSVNKGRLVNTFDQVPDAPITRFNLNIAGGRNGIIAVTRTRRALINLCATKRHIAEADIDGHNGRRRDTDIRMRTPCAKKSAKTKAQKRKAAKRRAAARRTRG